MAKAPDMDNNFDPENTNFFDDPEYYQGSKPSSSDPESSSEVSFEPGTPEGEEKYKQDLGAQDCQHRSMEFLGTAPDHNGESKDWFGCKNCDHFTSRHEAVQKSLANLAGDVDTGETAEGSEPSTYKKIDGEYEPVSGPDKTIADARHIYTVEMIANSLENEVEKRGETIQRQNMLARQTAAKHSAFIDSLRKHLNNYEG
jgi:hypothetical protein